MILNSSATSSTSSDEVGSSRTNTWAWMSMALAIATSCCTAMECEPSNDPGSMSRFSSLSTERLCLRMARNEMAPRKRGSRPSMMFSATERLVTRLTSWYTVATPACCASAGPANETSFPATSIEPASMLYTPVRALINVDLPAPFSPMRACTSPGNSRNETSLSALTPGKAMVMPDIRTTGSPTGAGPASATAGGPCGTASVVIERTPLLCRCVRVGRVGRVAGMERAAPV